MALIEWDSNGVTSAIQLDVAEREGYESTAEVTEHPVEVGPAIHDHIRPGAQTFTIEGMVTNTPVSIPRTQTQGATRAPGSVEVRVGRRSFTFTVQRWSSAFDRVKAVDELLAALVAGGQIVRLTTGLRTLSNLAITRYRVDREASTGNALALSLDFKRVRIVSTQRVAVPAVRRAQVPQSRGTQPAVPNDTVARRLFNSALGRRALGGG